MAKPYCEDCGTRHKTGECPMQGGAPGRKTGPKCLKTKAPVTSLGHIHICGKPKGHEGAGDPLHDCMMKVPTGVCVYIWRLGRGPLVP